jgi:hypothetical protein
MTYYEGVIDYFVLKKDDRYFIFLLDNHELNNCDYNSIDITELFENYINGNTSIFLEEVVGDFKVKALFSDSDHTNKNYNFYNKYKNKVIAVDVRILFQKKEELDKLFYDNYKIKHKINSSKKLKDLFEIMKQQYKLLEDKLFKKDYLSLDFIPLDYPYEYDKLYLNTDQQCEIFFSSLLDIYTIILLETSKTKNNFIYLGAFHCIHIFHLLKKYFDYRVIKDMDKTNNKFNLEKLNEYKKSCVLIK